MQIMIRFQSIGNKYFLLVPTMATPCSQPINEDINLKPLNLISNINANMFWVLLSSYVVKKERKKSTTLMTSFLMLFAKVFKT